MTILITGGTGLIGKIVTQKLRAQNHTVRILTRRKTTNPHEFYWNIDEKFIDEKALENIDSIIHLTGSSISKKWTKSYKKELYSSRIDSAKLLLKYCKNLDVNLQSFISSSGINYYGTFTRDNLILDEKPGIVQNDFLADLCAEWEKVAFDFSSIANRVVCLRTAMVLAKNDGAFPKLKKTVDFNLGSAVGTGKQWMNWIHVEDLVDMYIFALENTEIKGVYNAVSDEIPTNEEFMKTMSTVLNKAFLPINVPSFVMKLLFGEMSSIILEGTKASNEKIKSQGFDFQYKHLESALKSLV